MDRMRSVNPEDVPQGELHQYILGAVAPRPICFASTVDEHGDVNLAPYSFFNAFSSNPPMLIFSSNRRGSNNTTKDTLHNVEATGEVVINIVNHAIVRQMAIASIDYPADVNEFQKSGLTPIPSLMVQPPRVAESLQQFECKVERIIPLGDEGGAGNLIFCRPVLIHMAESIFNAEGKIDPQRTDQVGRMGRAFYSRAHGNSVFKLFQPFNVIGIGFDQLPDHIKNSMVLTGNELGEMAALPALPTSVEIESMRQEADAVNDESALHKIAGDYISNGEAKKALALLLVQLQ